MQSIDHDIRDTEVRLAWRRHQLDHTVHELGSTALRKLASPGTLATVAVIGFVVGGFAGRRPRKVQIGKDGAGTAKTTGVVGLLMTGAIALLRARYANPAAIMQLYSHFARKKQREGFTQPSRAAATDRSPR
jgi:hypothetical protein